MGKTKLDEENQTKLKNALTLLLKEYSEKVSLHDMLITLDYLIHCLIKNSCTHEFRKEVYDILSLNTDEKHDNSK